MTARAPWGAKIEAKVDAQVKKTLMRRLSKALGKIDSMSPEEARMMEELVDAMLSGDVQEWEERSSQFAKAVIGNRCGADAVGQMMGEFLRRKESPDGSRKN